MHIYIYFFFPPHPCYHQNLWVSVIILHVRTLNAIVLFSINCLWSVLLLVIRYWWMCSRNSHLLRLWDLLQHPGGLPLSALQMSSKLQPSSKRVRPPFKVYQCFFFLTCFILYLLCNRCNRLCCTIIQWQWKQSSVPQGCISHFHFLCAFSRSGLPVSVPLLQIQNLWVYEEIFSCKANWYQFILYRWNLPNLFLRMMC